MIKRFGAKISYLTVYILEAHASDTWPMGFDVEYKQTYTNEDRIKVANDFINNNHFEHPIRIDPAPENAFNSVFAAWPLRFYVITEDSVLNWIAEPFGDLMLVSSLSNYIEKLLNFQHKMVEEI